MTATQQNNAEPLIHVYLITYRRPALFKRSLASVLAQNYKNLLVKVLNDDPNDLAVCKIVSQANDRRVSLFAPACRRGGTANLNIAFTDTSAPFVSVLEDDNWWCPEFLEVMHQALLRYPQARAAVGNEIIWREMSDGLWFNTGRTVWSHDDTRIYDYDLDQLAGSAKICNSALLLRTDPAFDFETPVSIPVDVTEHFRDRLFDRPVVLVGRPLVNYAETIKTARSTTGSKWGTFQCLLIGSIFIALNNSQEKLAYANKLWDLCPSSTSPRAMTLIMAGLFIGEARPLFTLAPISAWMRFLLWMSKHPVQLIAMAQMRNKHKKELEFLVNAPLTQRLIAKARERLG